MSADDVWKVAVSSAILGGWIGVFIGRWVEANAYFCVACRFREKLRLSEEAARELARNAANPSR